MQLSEYKRDFIPNLEDESKLHESDQPPPPSPPSITWLERLQALFEVLLMSGIVSSFLAAQPFFFLSHGRAFLLQNARLAAGYILLEAGITLLFLILLLRAHGETFRGLGLRWTGWAANALIGLAIVPILFLLSAGVSEIFRIYFPRYFIEVNPLTEILRTPTDLGIFIFTVLIAGGIKEELQRAFIIRRFQGYLGGAVLGLLVWSAAFGAGHYVQGVQGMAVAGLLGLVFGIAYLSRGNLIIPIVAHGAYDFLALLGYWFLSR